MEDQEFSVPDWFNPLAYAPLLEADRSLIAWEWLRRDSLYQASATNALQLGIAPCTACERAEPFGLVTFELPQLSIPDARPLWHARIHPHVLKVEPATSSGNREMLDLAQLGGLVRLVTGLNCDHLLLSDGLRMIRLEGPKGIFSNGPIALSFIVEGVASAQTAMHSLRRLIALLRAGYFSRSRQHEAKVQRSVLLLRVADAIASGASQRHLAEVLLNRSPSESRWRSQDPSLRSRAQRLVRSARYLACGGYRDLLG